MDFSWISDGEKIVGFLILVIGAIAGFQKWFWRRVSSSVSASVSDLVVGHEGIEKRLEKVEGSVGQVKSDLERMRGRMGNIEGRLELLVTKDDLHEVSLLVARGSAGLEAQTNMTRMLYEAAQRAEKSGNK